MLLKLVNRWQLSSIIDAAVELPAMSALDVQWFKISLDDTVRGVSLVEVAVLINLLPAFAIVAVAVVDTKLAVMYAVLGKFDL